MRSRPATILATFLTLLLAFAIASQPAQARKFKVLHTFHGAPHDGALPWTQLVLDSEGNIYGTTEAGGDGKSDCESFGGCGTAFELDKDGKPVWEHSFGLADGFVPMAGLLRDGEGNLYGTTVLGGDTKCYQYGCGTVFKLAPNGTDETILHKFHATPDGWQPEALLVNDPSGNLYGTAYQGGKYGYGEVFKLDGTGKKSTLHSFAGPIDGGGDGAYPYPGVIRDDAGNLYGVTADGGQVCCGTVYEITPSGQETILYSFAGGRDGNAPTSVLLLDNAGNLYGTTQAGGNTGCTEGGGCAVVFKLSPQANGGYTESVLYVFCSLANCADGQRPLSGPLVLDPQGSLYGTTHFGGKPQCDGVDEGCGVVFKLERGGKETVLHDFTGGADGGAPSAGLTIDESGNLYGSTLFGGDRSCAIGSGDGCGVIFRLSP